MTQMIIVELRRKPLQNFPWIYTTKISHWFVFTYVCDQIEDYKTYMQQNQEQSISEIKIWQLGKGHNGNIVLSTKDLTNQQYKQLMKKKIQFINQKYGVQCKKIIPLYSNQIKDEIYGRLHQFYQYIHQSGFKYSVNFVNCQDFGFIIYKLAINQMSLDQAKNDVRVLATQLGGC